jgi:hypothetical protein
MSLDAARHEHMKAVEIERRTAQSLAAKQADVSAMRGRLESLNRSLEQAVTRESPKPPS